MNNEKRFSEGSTLISVTDLQGDIQYCNRDFIDISGYTENELIGSHHNIVRHPDMPKAAFKDLWDTIKDNRAWQGFVKNKCKNGDYYWVNAYVTPIFQDGEKVGYQSVRSCPTRDEVKKIESLYATLNANPDQNLPKPSFIKRLTLKPQINTLLALTFLVTLFSQWDSLSLQVSSIIMLLLTLSLFAGLYWLINHRIINALDDIIEKIERLSSGDLTENIQSQRQDEVGNTLMSVKLLQCRLKAIIGRFTESTQELSLSIDVLSETGYQTKTSMARQHAETELVATAMQEMSATVAEIAQNTTLTSELATSADTTAQDGKVLVESSRNTTQDLAHNISNVSGTVNTLAKECEEIKNITDTISSIANQTNLLALNAAIEAARAGELGRGFAVVADEVRVLASRTQEATVEINDMIETLHVGSQSAVTAMDEGLISVNDSVDKIQETEEAFTEIAASVINVNDMNIQIATAAEEQSAVAEEMNANIQSINEQSYRTTSNVDQLEDKIIALTDMTASLKLQLQQYNIGESSVVFDFEAAKSAHLAWKARVRSFLQGDTSAITKKQACSHKECQLGKWYYSDGMNKYKNSKEFQSIEAPHARLHEIIKEIIGLHERNKLNEADELYEELSAASDEIVRLLDETENAL